MNPSEPKEKRTYEGPGACFLREIEFIFPKTGPLHWITQFARWAQHEVFSSTLSSE